MRNWTIKEAIEGINANDPIAIKEISKHFPEFFLAVARNDMAALAAMMPEKFTVRRLAVAGAATNEAADTDEGETNEAVADDADLSAMSTKELIALCGQRGIKVPKYGKNKQFYLDALGAAADGEGDEPESDEDEEGEGTNPYEGKSAMELFKECKKRGLKAEPKKKAAYYADLLTKDDAKADDEDASGDDEDWGDDEAEEETKKAPAKKAPAKKAPAKKESKPATKAKAKVEDDDDDWDI